MAHLDQQGGFGSNASVNTRSIHYSGRPRSQVYVRRVRAPMVRRVGVLLDEAAGRVLGEQKQRYSKRGGWIVPGYGTAIVVEEETLVKVMDDSTLAGMSLVMRTRQGTNQTFLSFPCDRNWFPVMVVTTRDLVSRYVPSNKKELLHTESGRLYLVCPSENAEFEVRGATYRVERLRNTSRIRTVKRA